MDCLSAGALSEPRCLTGWRVERAGMFLGCDGVSLGVYRLARGVSQQMLRKVFPLVNSTDNIRSTYHFDDIGDMFFFQSANDCCRTLANIFRD